MSPSSPPPSRITLSTLPLPGKPHQHITVLNHGTPHLDGTAIRELYEMAMLQTDHFNVRLIIDLTAVQSASSSAMGILIEIQKKLRHVGGKLWIVLAAPMVREQFEVMNLHRLLTLVPSREIASEQAREDLKPFVSPDPPTGTHQ